MRTNVAVAPTVRTAMLVCARGVLLIGLVFAIDRAFAGGKVYRCGNLFQDQPCATAPVDAARPADKSVVVVPAERAVVRSAGVPDRPISEAPRAMVIEARR